MSYYVKVVVGQVYLVLVEGTVWIAEPVRVSLVFVEPFDVVLQEFHLNVARDLRSHAFASYGFGVAVN